MRKVALHMMTTLDGCVAGPNGELDWLFNVESKGRNDYVFKLYSEADGILVGRQTYLACAGYWPSAETKGGKEGEFAHFMNNLPKYVVTTTLDKVDWANSSIVKGSLADGVARLKQQSGSHIVLIGGLRTVQSMIKLGLIDEFHLMMHPVALGHGMPLFDGLPEQLGLELIDAKPFDQGVVGLHYRPSPK